jgi:hypothetical protein
MVVLRNKCLNLLEQTRIRQLYIEEIDDETIYQRANLYVLQDEASQIVESEDLHKAIERALSKLPDENPGDFYAEPLRRFKESTNR